MRHTERPAPRGYEKKYDWHALASLGQCVPPKDRSSGL